MFNLKEIEAEIKMHEERAKGIMETVRLLSCVEAKLDLLRFRNRHIELARELAKKLNK
jgi:ABC-type branched-subunit amino acid transport system ATPase component